MAYLDGTSRNDILQGREEDDDIVGQEGHDRLSGGAGDDNLWGDSGNDTLNGEEGDDWANGGLGDDLLLGGDGDDMLYGLEGDDKLQGGAGNDYLSGGSGVDSYDGGTDEGYIFGSVSVTGDRISFYQLHATAGVVADLRTGIIANDGFGNRETMRGIESLGGGTAFADTFRGSNVANLLFGSTGDTLMSFAGDDRFDLEGAPALLDGGEGIDTLVYFQWSKHVPDQDGDGRADQVTSDGSGAAVDLELGTMTDAFGDTGTIRGVENFAGTFGTFDDTLLGDDQDNVIRGFGGVDTIDGRGGSDTVSYESLNPFSWYNSAWGGVEIDLAAGYSEETALKSSTVAAGTPRFGRDTLAGIENIIGSGLGDRLLGDGGDNVIASGAGDDYINGRAGKDTLSYAGARASVVVDLGSNSVDEVGTREVRYETHYDDQGNEYEETIYAEDGLRTQDRVYNVEDVIGTAFGDRLAGDAAANRMEGGGGEDRFYWSGGGDLLDGQAGNDRLDLSTTGAGGRVDLEAGTLTAAGVAGTDRLVGIESVEGSDRADQISGDRGANFLDGAGGADRLEGRGGNDVYMVDTARDSVVEAVDGGLDTVESDTNYVLAANVENLELYGYFDDDAIAGTGNALANRITGNDIGNRLDGRAGADTLVGGRGNDSYAVDNAGDRIIEAGGEGFDRVSSTIDYTLGHTLENLTLRGTGDIAGVGNVYGNQITGNGGANRISGAQGDDMLVGGAGDDILVGGFDFDSLRGGTGRDAFVMDGRFDGGDRILDFSSAHDRIELDRSLFSGFESTGSLRLAAFRQGNEAQDESDRILYNEATGRVLYDADGTGAIDPVLIATLTRGTDLVAADFVIVA